ncbi:MAG: hypothetical protein HKN23_12150 [Verrucomicrobiales bacterium]|nr:hypothetical protein [Verrucomicrobiales bacterium]
MIPDAVIIEEFGRLTREILRHDGPRGFLVGLVGELIDILETAAELQIDPHADIAEGETTSRHGLAISPAQAAMCAGEEQRTAVFLRGLHDAIVDAVASNHLPKPVRVLYAGSGPYAVLATPLMAIFPPEEVQFTILDIHAESIEAARSVVRRLNFESSVESFVVADACEYRIPEKAVPDIILSETMSTALEKEPQVAILRHLLKQAPNATLVPESVRIDAFLVDTSREIERVVPESEAGSVTSQPDRIPAGPVFDLNKSTIRSWESISDDRLPAAAITLPVAPDPYYQPFLFTSITTHGDHVLRTHESGLTAIRAFPVTGSTPAECRTLQFHYRLGPNPRLIAEAAGQADCPAGL